MILEILSWLWQKPQFFQVRGILSTVSLISSGNTLKIASCLVTAYSSCQWVRIRVHPGQVTRAIAGLKHKDWQMLTLMANLESPVIPITMSLDCGRTSTEYSTWKDISQQVDLNTGLSCCDGANHCSTVISVFKITKWFMILKKIITFVKSYNIWRHLKGTWYMILMITTIIRKIQSLLKIRLWQYCRQSLQGVQNY